MIDNQSFAPIEPDEGLLNSAWSWLFFSAEPFDWCACHAFSKGLLRCVDKFFYLPHGDGIHMAPLVWSEDCILALCFYCLA